MRIFKAVAAGNDFLVLDARDRPAAWEPGAARARALCDRREGLGADGVVTLGASDAADAAFMLRNCDGSAAAFSGNGARCAALVLARATGGSSFTIATSFGPRPVRALGPSAAEASLGAPRDVRLGLALPAGTVRSEGDHAIVGVPYLAVRVEPDELAALDVARVAPPLRRWVQPEGANVAFWCEDGQGARLRTFERGVEAETPSSGTGCAAVALAIALRRPGRSAIERIELATASGERLAVTVVSDETGSHDVTDLRLSGAARVVAEILPEGLGLDA